MSTTTIDNRTSTGGPRAAVGEPREVSGIPFQRLVRLELRKGVDTRAGLWMLIAMGVVSVVVQTVILIWGEDTDRTFGGLLGPTLLPLILLLPVLGILAATQEWSQRTGLVTFTLEPRRARVVGAKLLAGLGLGLVVVAVAFAAAAVGQLIALALTDAPADWSMPAGVVGGVVLGLALYVAQGMAFGFLLRNTPLAIVGSFLLPTVWSIVSNLIPAVKNVAPWLDLNQVTGPLFDGDMKAADWGHLATGAGLWILLPLAVATWQIRRMEIK